MSERTVAQHMAAHLIEHAEDIARTWLEILSARLEEHPNQIFPTEALLDHVPATIVHLAEQLADGQLELGQEVEQELYRLSSLRRAQGYSLEELLDEFRLLEHLLYDSLDQCLSQWQPAVRAVEMMRAARHFNDGFRTIERVTTRAFVRGTLLDEVERVELLSTFSRSISHELRNRMNQATLAMHLLTRDRIAEDPTRREEAVGALSTAFERIDGIAEDVLALALSAERESRIEGRRRPLPAVFASLRRDVSEFARRHGVALHWPPEVPEFMVDATRLELALLNVLHNAVKYRDDQEEPPWIRVSLAFPSDDGAMHWRIDVEDNGIGISEDLQERIFDRSFRGANKAEQPGQGLGLSIARTAIEQLGGRLTVESTPGRGSTFSLLLPSPTEAVTPAPRTGGEAEGA